MNAAEIAYISGKKDTCIQFIKEQHRLPKRERNQGEIDQTKVKIGIFTKWLNDN